MASEHPEPPNSHPPPRSPRHGASDAAGDPVAASASRLRALVPHLAVLAGALLVHGWLQASTDGFPDRDARLHGRLAALIAAGDAPWHGLEFPWLTTSAYADRPLDWSLGWHLLLVPFVAAFGALTGLKIAVALQASLLTAAFHAVLRGLRVRGAVLWTVAFVMVFPVWLHRIHMGRPTPLVIVALLALAYALLQRRALLAAAMAAASMLLYHVPAPPLLVAGAILGATWWTDRRAPVRLAGAVLAGLFLGLVLHPGFHDVRGGAPWLDRGSFALWNLMADSLEFGRRGGHVVMSDGDRFGLPVPLELGTPSLGVLWREMHGALLATACALLLLLRRRGRTALATAALAAALLAVTTRSGRLFEYWHPFAMLAAAVAISGPEGFVDRVSRRVVWTVAIAAALLNVRALPGLLEKYNPDDTADCRAALRVIDSIASPGDVCWIGNFADFAPAFFHAPRLRYPVGMDSYYLLAHDAEKAREFVRIGTAHARGDELRFLLTRRFDARFVLLWNPRTKGEREAPYLELYTELREAPWATELHADEACAAFELSPWE